MATVKAKVKPELLVWAREEAGLTLEHAAQKLGVPPVRLTDWEQGVDAPTINQLRKAAEVYKRPLAVFYLPDIPRRFRVMQDFRRLPGEVAGHYSPELRLELRDAAQKRDLALDLLQEVGDDTPEFGIRASMDDDPEAVGRQIRAALNVDIAEQERWREPRVAFNTWRARIEASRVLVFQAINVPLEEMRGFSIAEPVLPVIEVNRKDTYSGRLFSLLHEFTHLMLRRSGICDFDEDAGRSPEEQRVEVFCNRVAGAALVPRDELLRDPLVVAAPTGTPAWADETVEALARRYGTSREVIVRRLLICGRTTEGFYRAARARYLVQYQARQAEQSTDIDYRRNMPREIIGHFGPAFVRLVLQTYHQRRITLNDVSSYLGVRLKHIPAIEQAVR